jgi:CubicO group peptidase (beta-lactamase class C family)
LRSCSRLRQPPGSGCGDTASRWHAALARRDATCPAAARWGKKLATGLGWWRRHEADDGSDLVEHLGGGGSYRNLMRVYPNSGRAAVMFGNLTSYPVEHLTAAVLASGNGRRVPPGEE